MQLMQTHWPIQMENWASWTRFEIFLCPVPCQSTALPMHSYTSAQQPAGWKITSPECKVEVFLCSLCSSIGQAKSGPGHLGPESALRAFNSTTFAKDVTCSHSHVRSSLFRHKASTAVLMHSYTSAQWPSGCKITFSECKDEGFL